MKVLVFIEHDIVIRHFVHSRVFTALMARHEVTFIFPEPGYKRVTVDVSKLELGAPFRHLTVHQRRLVIWKRLFQVDLLRWRWDRSFAPLRSLHREMIGSKAAMLYSLLALPGVYQLFKRWSFGRIGALPNLDLEQLIAELAPDLMIHPSVLEGVYINDLVAISKNRNIPLTAIMNSWDNPCTKRAMVGAPDWLLVWGEQTKRHAMMFVGMAADRAISFGSAQFDVYRNAPRIDRAAFCDRHDIDSNARILLYAGSSKGTDEYAHLAAIDEAIANGALGNAVVVYRPHPWGGGGKDGGRFLDRAWRHVRIETTMRAYLERVRAGEGGASLPDYRDTHDVLSSVDALLSPLSTILLEGALHGKPVLCFLPEDETDARHFQLAASLKHFEDMFAMPEFLVVRGREELVSGIHSLISRIGDEDFAARLRETCAYFVEPFEVSYSERLVEFVETTGRER